MHISLKPEQEKLIKDLIESGRYQTFDEAIAWAFQLLEKEARHYQQWVEDTRKKIAQDLRS